MLRLRILSALLLAALSTSGLMFAQTSLGTIVGNVTDESGAAIPAVSIKVINEATAAERTATSNNVGTYTIPALPSGTYTVQAEMAGGDL